ncbi:hypothetical protein CDAR_102641 [Caerostris darwini]|uniref:DUF6570 domain-containing protein n=1 Tax=Caerostris darwini TaxID=1538125 RepID=A0AAV4PCK4_9ARAC|nr:hypothetical protein CDAR_102641 [Caerostris darwini]
MNGVRECTKERGARIGEGGACHASCSLAAIQMNGRRRTEGVYCGTPLSYSKADLRARGFTDEQIAIIFSVDLDEADFCKTCSDHIRKRNVPNLAANYGFRYPEQPSCLSELNDLEERLVALRIPFMQIRELGRDRQYGIKGSVTNVPNDLHFFFPPICS